MTVDVLLPTYRPKHAHLTAALKSLQNQTMQDWRAFIHDDCSEGSETEEIVKPFLADPRITFMKSPVRLGIGGNWNACLKETDAEIVAYLFQDDTWNADYLTSAVEALRQHPSAGFASMDHAYEGEGSMTNLPLYQAVRASKKTVKLGLHDGREFLRFWMKNELHPNLIGEPSFVVMRRGAMEKAGPFLEDMPQFLDTEYWLRLLTVSDWVNVADKEYGSFRVHPAAASALNQETGTGLFDRLRCFERLIARLSGDDKRMAIRARNAAVEKMVKKFRNRVGSGKKTSGQGVRALLLFCLRHPLLIIRSFVRSTMS